MANTYEFIRRMPEALTRHDSWTWFPVPLPKTPESWTGVLVALVVVAAAYWALWKLRSRNDGDAFLIESWSGTWPIFEPDSWNIVEIRESTARKVFDPTVHSGDVKEAALKFHGSSVRCRLKINKKYKEDSLYVHTEVLKQLGFPIEKNVIEKRPDAPEKTPDDTQNNMPTWRLRVDPPGFHPGRRSFNSLDSSVRLQWRLGLLFLILGIVIPKSLAIALGW